MRVFRGFHHQALLPECALTIGNFDGCHLGHQWLIKETLRLAKLWGAEGFRVEKAAQLESTIRAAIACGKPAIVDIQVDPNALYSFRRDSFKHRDKAAGAK